ncbi:hypothetical protein SDC9_163578 [bioreactor metagenome]|uniref:Uncharacterized protein n=1 Tax=bioreactor metagenome TaxID=1076179 RepID=A0A645FQR1_9ZZZZ
MFGQAVETEFLIAAHRRMARPVEPEIVERDALEIELRQRRHQRGFNLQRMGFPDDMTEPLAPPRRQIIVQRLVRRRRVIVNQILDAHRHQEQLAFRRQLHHRRKPPAAKRIVAEIAVEKERFLHAPRHRTDPGRRALPPDQIAGIGQFAQCIMDRGRRTTELGGQLPGRLHGRARGKTAVDNLSADGLVNRPARRQMIECFGLIHGFNTF